ncbi:hypothetical protein BKA66DRAFT_475292 [Pyrenochaeta sp. MPI-SDFR-AT-0127]|nr:hypothetical protein BKA66DRAFT_475292 [Pyrenochaeta sp. MPI-SDFR-AT-0127]
MPDSAISVLPEGGLVLVTGISGYVGSNVADQILTAGYKVRGIVRSTTKARWLSDHFEKQYGADSFHLVEISDMLKAGALDEAVKGVSAIAHVATVAPLSGYPDPYIAQVTGLVLNLLESASREPKMKRFVFTSSSMAAANPAQDLERIITDRSWNEEACNDAWVGPFGDSNIWNVYAASKATAEQKAFEWMSANSPSFEFNSILPNTNFGPTLSREHQGFGSTGAMLKSVFDGNTKAIAEDPPRKT